jgi:zinc transport system ATP-binding protein
MSELSFTVKSGEYLCIVGENGSGKSTLIKALLSLKSVTKGDILMGDGLKRNEIGYLPQQTSAQKDFPASVFEVVLSGCLNNRGLRPFYSKADRLKALSTMEKLGIKQFKRRSYRELSGGQQQRVLLARALLSTKKLLLLDEPVAGLDPIVTNELYQLIKQINTDGITIIMVSHDIESAVKYASHILHLHNKPLFYGTTEEYIKSDAGRRFLGGVEHA